MSDPYVMARTRRAYVTILGYIWMPRVLCSMQKQLSNYDLENIGEFTRENIDQWLTSNSGDFSSVVDFTARCGETEIEWSSEENEMSYLDTVSEVDD